MGKTTRDEIDIDLNGSIDRAIKELQRLKRLYPRGKISLENEYEYGESYARLKLQFTRKKEPLELEYDKWRDKLEHLGKLRRYAAAYEHEGDAYPRQSELDALVAELGAWAQDDWRMGSLTIFDGELLMHDHCRGGFTREGEWRYRMMGAEMWEAAMGETSPDRNPQGEKPQALSS